MKRPHRWLLASLAGLLAVAVIDAAIAFGCARWAPRRGTASDISGFKTGPPTAGLELESLPPGYSRLAMVEHGPGYEYYAVLSLYERKRQTTKEFGHGMRLEAGLPFRSWLVIVDRPPTPNAPPDYRGWFWSSSDVLAVPAGTLTQLRPLWFGLAGNISIALAAAAILLLTLRTGRLLRRHLRTRRGRCPKCGYDRAGLPDPAAPCPECGATR